MSNTIHDIIGIIKRGRFDLQHEKTTQAQMDAWLKRHGFSLDREHYLDDSNIPDFFHEGIAIEVKIKGRKKDIYAQVLRYAKFEAVTSLILCTNKSMGFPPEINGKPCYYIHLGKAYL